MGNEGDQGTTTQRVIFGILKNRGLTRRPLAAQRRLTTRHCSCSTPGFSDSELAVTHLTTVFFGSFLADVQRSQRLTPNAVENSSFEPECWGHIKGRRRQECDSNFSVGDGTCEQ